MKYPILAEDCIKNDCVMQLRSVCKTCGEGEFVIDHKNHKWLSRSIIQDCRCMEHNY